MHPLAKTYAHWETLTPTDKELAAEQLLRTSRGHWILNYALHLAIEHERQQGGSTQPGSDLFDMELLHTYVLSNDRIGLALDGKRLLPIR